MELWTRSRTVAAVATIVVVAMRARKGTAAPGRASCTCTAAGMLRRACSVGVVAATVLCPSVQVWHQRCACTCVEKVLFPSIALTAREFKDTNPLKYDDGLGDNSVSSEKDLTK